ncbi:MAG: 3-deoxy-D-manno-octulosonic acid transferase [Hyphomicrobiales bacterium]|nr:3-deoxy-D-manno-octulosonic acid transferase [Hyphomicrobiales bacterium]
MAERIGDAALALYRTVGRLLAPALPLMLAVRTRAGKEDPTRRHERLGRPRRRRPEGPLVWVHGASVGETISVLPLIERIVADGVGVLVTSGTVTSARIAADRLPAGAFHQFAPLDVAGFIDGFLDHWRPSAAIFVESEIWPTTIERTHRRGIPLVLVNARMSERSFARWRRLGALPRALFRRFSLALAQAEGDGGRLAALGVERVEITGNLKFDGLPLGGDPVEGERLARAIGGRPTWIAASTHPGEEAVAIDVHTRARERLPGLLTVIAPRHPERGDALRADFAEHGLVVASRSRGETPGPRTDVYLADTIGEMGLVYRLAPIAFVGGSITPRGGQNPIEPARLDVAVLHGPSTRNFAEIYRDLDACGGAAAIEDAETLADALVDLLERPERRAAQTAAARTVVDRSAGALQRTLTALAPTIARARTEERAR